jgi:hypothetical protein
MATKTTSTTHLPGHPLTPRQIMWPIRQNLRLHNRHQPCRLADGGVGGQPRCIGCQGGSRGQGVPLDVEHRPPLGKACAGGVVLVAACFQTIQALAGNQQRGGWMGRGGEWWEGPHPQPANSDVVHLHPCCVAALLSCHNTCCLCVYYMPFIHWLSPSTGALPG